MNTAIITFSKEGYILAKTLKRVHPNWVVFLHNNILSDDKDIVFFDHITDCIGTIFNSYKGIVFIGPCGIAVRSISKYITSKLSDPAVVVIDAGGRFAVSLLSGHEGGANQLTIEIAGIIGAEPCISTTTEAVKSITAGIGCRKGTSQETIIDALKSACDKASIELHQIRVIATAAIKCAEQGLIEACTILNIPLLIVPNWQILRCGNEITRSEFVENITGLPGVAEPAALVSGRDTVLLLRKYVYQGVTIAFAKERFLWSE